jgi:MFS family permease
MEHLALLVVGFILTVLSALLTTYIAQGKPFWRWFFIGMVLPYLSIFIAMFIVYREQRAEEKQQDKS